MEAFSSDDEMFYSSGSGRNTALLDSEETSMKDENQRKKSNHKSAKSRAKSAVSQKSARDRAKSGVS